MYDALSRHLEQILCSLFSFQILAVLVGVARLHFLVWKLGPVG
jgi:hypothetical protein